MDILLGLVIATPVILVLTAFFGGMYWLAKFLLPELFDDSED